MAIFEHPKPEAFAQGLARGLCANAAAEEAGYSRHVARSKARAGCKAVVERVEEIKLHRIGGGTREIAPLLDELAAMARTAAGLGSAAGMREARGFLADVARLKALLPRETTTAPAAASRIEPEAKLSNAEWLAQFAPKPAPKPEAAP